LGKIELAFDHLINQKEIQELSVVVYTDSFFYGLWGADNTLMKSDYHPMSSLQAKAELWSYYYDFDKVNLISAIKPFVHLANSDYQKKHHNLYFQGLYNLDRLDNHTPINDRFKDAAITTLHYLNEKAVSNLNANKLNASACHISTAMSNYASASDSDLVCFIANNILHLCLHTEAGFRLYNQFDCYYKTDYLYFLSLVCDQLKLDRNQVTVSIGGEYDEESRIYELLSKYFYNISFLGKDISFSSPHNKDRSNYYDLYICKSCVS